MGTRECDIKDASEQLIPKTLKALLAKQTKIMYYSNNLMSWNRTANSSCFEIFRVNEAEFILRVVSFEGHALCVEGK